MWEIPSLAIISELRSRGGTEILRPLRPRRALCPRQGQDVGEGRAAASGCRDLRISDFGTRRRHSFLWHRWCVEALKEGIGDAFTGTSNVLLAMDTDLEAVGTNGHELPMVAAALPGSDDELRRDALPGAAGLEPPLWRQPAHRAARRLRHRSLPSRTRRTGSPTGPASGPIHRHRSRAGKDHLLVEGKGTRSAREAADLLRRARRRHDRDAPTVISTAACA